MDTIEEIRLANLERLLAEGWTKARLARALGRDARQAGQWFGKGAKRSMSSAVARELEAAINKPRGWLDNVHSSTAVTLSAQPVRLDAVTVSDAKGAIRFLLPAGRVFDASGDVDLFILAYQHMAGDPSITREGLERAIAENVASGQGNEDGPKASTRGKQHTRT